MNTLALPKTKQYLLETLDRHSDNNCNYEFLKYTNYLSEGSPGVGGPKITSPSYEDFATVGGLYAGAKTVSSGLDWLADAIESAGAIYSPDIAKGVMSKLPDSLTRNSLFGGAATEILKGGLGKSSKVVSAMLRNLSDMTGASYFEKNLENIGKANIENVVSGAGKPFAPLLIPQRDERSRKEKEELFNYFKTLFGKGGGTASSTGTSTTP